MENIQRNLEKELSALSVPKSSRKPKRWTFLFIGDHGKIISIKRFKGVALFLFFLLFLAVSSSIVLYYLYRQTHRSKENLNNSLKNLHRQVISLRNEKDVLLARLVVAESDLALLKHRSEKKQTRQVSETAPEKPLPDVKKAADSPDEKEGLFVKRRSEKIPAAAEAAVTSQPEIPSVVAVEDLKITYEADGKTYRAQFKLRNTSPNSEPISGYTAVVLRNKEMEPDKGLTFPKLKLVSGRPAGLKRGQYFSIARFKTVKFKTIHYSDPEQYNLATIFVFDSKNNLILEENFPSRVEKSLSVSDE